MKILAIAALPFGTTTGLLAHLMNTSRKEECHELQLL